MNSLFRWLIGWPERVAQHLQWVAPLFARIVVGFRWRFGCNYDRRDHFSQVGPSRLSRDIAGVR
jgi:hypothetical protein